MSQQRGTPRLEAILDADVVVIGAGAASAASATYMAKEGLRVTVLEQKYSPREGDWGYCVSPGALRELQNLGVTSVPQIIETNIIDHATVYLSGKELVTDDFPAVEDMPRYARIVPKKSLENAVLEAARNAGANILEGASVINFAVENDWVTVIAEHYKQIKTIRARLLIGADGPNSIVARKLKGTEWSKTERAYVARAIFENVTGAPNEANLFYGNDSFPGYSWIFPTSKYEANVGIGIVAGCTPPTESPEELLKKLVQNDEAMRIRLKNAKIKGNIEVALLNLHDEQVPLIGNRVIVIGLAAGLVNPYNGEGIQMGLLSAKYAAETAQTCMINNDFSAPALTPYTKRIEAKWGYGFRLSAFILGLLRNRNMNQAWLQWVELTGQKSKSDPAFSDAIAGILSGMIFPNEESSATALTGTLQETALSVGMSTFSDMMNNPSNPSQPSENVRQTGAAMAQYAASDPATALRWGLDAISRMSEIAMAASTQAIKDNEKKPQNQQQ